MTHPLNHSPRRHSLSLLIALVVLTTVAAPVAQATFPGKRGPMRSSASPIPSASARTSSGSTLETGA